MKAEQLEAQRRRAYQSVQDYVPPSEAEVRARQRRAARRSAIAILATIAAAVAFGLTYRALGPHSETLGVVVKTLASLVFGCALLVLAFKLMDGLDADGLLRPISAEGLERIALLCEQHPVIAERVAAWKAETGHLREEEFDVLERAYAVLVDPKDRMAGRQQLRFELASRHLDGVLASAGTRGE